MKTVLVIALIALVSELLYIGVTEITIHQTSMSINDEKIINIDGYVAENIAYDEVTEKYWWIFSDRNDYSIRLASSPDLKKWEIEKESIVGPNSDSACLKKFGDFWYIYYGKYNEISPDSSVANVYMIKSSFVNKDYSFPKLVLKVGNEENDWDQLRVSEPDVIYVNGAYLLFYMGEDSNRYERIGYAISDNPEGNFVKYSNNPVLVGTPEEYNQWNSGKDKAADPFVLPVNDGYLIQYTACKENKKNWAIGWAFTKDFFNFKIMEHPILTRGISATRTAVVRGGLIKVNDKYIMSFSTVEDFCKLSTIEVDSSFIKGKYNEYINKN